MVCNSSFHFDFDDGCLLVRVFEFVSVLFCFFVSQTSAVA